MVLLGFFIEKNILTVACVAKEKEKFLIKELRRFVLDKELKEFNQFLEILALKESDLFYVCGLPTKDLLIRSVEFPIKNERQLWKALPFELENLLPYPPEEGITIAVFEKDFYKNEKTKNSLVSFFSYTKNSYKNCLNFFSDRGISPQWVSSVAQALYRFCSDYTSEKELVAIHMEEESTQIIVITKGCLVHAFEIEIGKQHFLEELSKDRPLLSKDEKETFFYQIEDFESLFVTIPCFAKLRSVFLQELDRIFYFLSQKKEGESLEKLFFVKEERFLMQFKKPLEEALDLRFDMIEIKDEKLKPFAISIGLCIDVLKEDRKTLQFKTEGEDMQKFSGSIFKKIASYALVSLSFFIVTLLGSHFLLKKEERQIHKELSSIVDHYKHEFVDLEFQEKEKDLFDRISSLEKSFGKTKKPCHYYLNPKSLSQILSTFETSFLQGGDEHVIEELDYELVDFPTLKAPLNPYEIKVKLVLKLEEEVNCECFLDNKIFPEEWTDLTITKNPPYYEVSFFIKTAK